jgi:sec-independent protein translocase protein TatB
MEIIIALVVFGGILWFYFSRDGKKETVSAPDKVEETANISAPYKVPEPAATTPIPLLPAGTEASVAAPAPVKAKAPAKPKAAAKPKAPAKTAATKAPAKTAKPKAPAKPKVTVAK